MRVVQKPKVRREEEVPAPDTEAMEEEGVTALEAEAMEEKGVAASEAMEERAPYVVFRALSLSRKRRSASSSSR